MECNRRRVKQKNSEFKKRGQFHGIFGIKEVLMLFKIAKPTFTRNPIMKIRYSIQPLTAEVLLIVQTTPTVIVGIFAEVIP